MKHPFLPSTTLFPSLALASVGIPPTTAMVSARGQQRSTAPAPICSTCELQEIPYSADLPVLNYQE